MEDAVVLKYKDVVLRGSDLATLRGPCLLVDQIIAFYFTYLSSSIVTKTDVWLFRPDDCQLIAAKDKERVEEIVQACKFSRVVLFVVNDMVQGGQHWSTLVYDRTKNLFLHFDSIKRMNNSYAEDLYNAVKEYMGPGGEVSRPQPQASSSLRKKQRNKKKSVPSVTEGAKGTALAGLPEFRECETLQQTNGVDCGLYVLAIAREICLWCSRGHNKSDMISTIQKNVDYSVETNMRDEVLKIIKEITTDS